MSDSTPQPYTPPEVQQRAVKPAGLLPKHVQALWIGGISVVMMIVIALSARNAPKDRASTPTPNATVIDPNDERIREYRARIEQEAKKLADEQARLSAIKTSLGADADTSASMPVSAFQPRGISPSPRSDVTVIGGGDEGLRMQRDRRERDPRFASNIALSHRQPDVPPPAAPTQDPSALLHPPANATKSLTATASELQLATGKTYRLFEGTVIETVLTNRLDASFSGPVSCLVTTPVYSHDHQELLIPQGSRVLGEVSKVESFGQQRLAVAFSRLIMPDGYSVSLERQPGLSQQGETGIVDQIQHHYLQIFGVSLAIGAIAGLSQANTQYGFNASAEDAYRQGVASSLSQSSLNILNRYLNVLPTFTIREGQRIKVYLTGDLLVPAYVNHRLPADL